MYEKLFEYLLNNINILRVEKKNENTRHCIYVYMKNSRNFVALFHRKKLFKHLDNGYNFFVYQIFLKIP